GAAREPVEIQRIGCEGDRFAQRADQAPRIAPFRGLVLARGDQDSALRIRERRVIDVLADVILIHPHRSVGGECEILRIREVQLLRFGSGVRQADVPEPDGGLRGERQRDLVFDVLPAAAAREGTGRRSAKTRRARGAEKGRPVETAGTAPQEEIGRAALDLAAHEEVQGRTATVQAAYAAALRHVGPEAAAAGHDFRWDSHAGYRIRIPHWSGSRCSGATTMRGDRSRLKLAGMNSIPKPSQEPRPAFGSVLAPTMTLARYQNGAWGRFETRPCAPIELHPAAHVLHYSSTCFEGFKAYRWADGSVNVFRMDRHIERMRQSARALVLPEPDPRQLEDMIRTAIDRNRDVVPEAPGALYLRPILFGTTPNIGAAGAAATEASLIVLASPVWDYFAGATGMKALRIYIEDVNART